MSEAEPGASAPERSQVTYSYEGPDMRGHVEELTAK